MISKPIKHNFPKKYYVDIFHISGNLGRHNRRRSVKKSAVFIFYEITLIFWKEPSQINISLEVSSNLDIHDN